MTEELNLDTVSKPDAWQTRYEKEQAGWERGETHPALADWCADHLIEPPSHVIIPGCGRGHETIFLAQQGFVVTAIDFAAAPIAYLRDKLGDLKESVSVHQQDVFSFEPETAVDVVYEQTCLCAIAPDRRGEYEQALFRWLKPGGYLLALFMQTKNPNDGPPFHCDPAEMKQLFPASRWNWKSDQLTRFDHPSGKVYELAMVLQKNS